MRILPVLYSCGIGISPDPARPAGNEDAVAVATIKSKQNLRHPFHRIEQTMRARSLASAMARTLWCSRFLVASRHGLRPFCPIPDDPKLLDFRPVEAHSSKHHRLRIDQASVAERRAAPPRARGPVDFVRLPRMPPGAGGGLPE